MRSVVLGSSLGSGIGKADLGYQNCTLAFAPWPLVRSCEKPKPGGLVKILAGWDPRINLAGCSETPMLHVWVFHAGTRGTRDTTGRELINLSAKWQNRAASTIGLTVAADAGR